MLLLFLCWLTSAFAEILWDIPEIKDRQIRVVGQHIRGTVTVPFGGVMGRGFYPANVRVQNTSASKKEVVVTIQHPVSNNDLLRQTVQLAAGESKEFNYVLPLPQTSYATMYFTMATEGSVPTSYKYSFRIFDPAAFSYSEFGPPRVMIGNDTSQSKFPEWYAAAQMAGKSTGFDSLTYLTSEEWLPNESATYSGLHSVIWFADELSIGAQ